MNRKLRNFLLIVLIMTLPACARMCDGIKAKGQIIGSSYAPYIVISQSGGYIMDVYKLESAIVQSPSTSDGWLFVDGRDRPIFLGGDVKTIRLKSVKDETWDQYHEYHMEFETLTYREKFNE